MADEQRSSIGRKVATVAVALVAVLGVVGAAAAYRYTQAGRGHFCTAAGSLGPTAETPEQAFDAWWATYRPDLSQEEGDIDRDGTTWHVDKGREGWTKVEVDRADRSLGWDASSGNDPDRWTVVAANRCSYADV